MNNEQITEKVMEHEGRICGLEKTVMTIAEQQVDIKSLVDSTHSLALSVQKLTDKVSSIDERTKFLESDKRQKSFAIWNIAVAGTLGAVITYVVTTILKGA